MPATLLSVRDLTKRYAVTVLDRASLDVRAGEIHALIGANGAGKSTMCRIVAGLLDANAGSMTLDGQTYAPASKQAAEAAGVQIVQQELNLIASLSVAENLLFGRLPQTLGVIHRDRLHQRARTALDRFGLSDIDTDTPTGSLGVGQQQMIEIAAALDRRCRLLILDEPTAALSAGESETLFQWLRELAGRGTGIIYISHRLEEISSLAARVTILRDGRTVGTHDTTQLSANEMVDWMTGQQDPQHHRRHQSFATDSIALRVQRLSRQDAVDDVSFHVRAGERFGIAGLVGSGRTELLRLIFGADRADAGHVRVGDDGVPRRFSHPAEAVQAGLAMVTEDRKASGLLLSQSVRVNTSLAAMWTRFSAGGLVRFRAEREAAVDLCRSMETRCTSVEQIASTLSGGNQQKVAVAKWLVRDAEVFFFDEPTRGIDMPARRRIYELFDSLAADGKALVIVSSDLEELLETCDRIAVMSLGRLVDTFTREDWSEDKIMQAAFSEHMSRSP